LIQATGQVGRYITAELLKTGKQLTALTRSESTAKIPAGLITKKVDYNNHQSLVDALKGEEVLIIIMSVTAPKEQEGKLIKAAADAGVKYIVPNEFGGDYADPKLNADLAMISASKAAHRKQIEELGKSKWFGIICGFWYEYSLSCGTMTYGFDIPNRTVQFYNEGETRMLTSTWAQTGRAVANLLSLKVRRDDESDIAPTLTELENQFIKVSSFNTSQKEILASLLRVTKTKQEDWRITSASPEEIFTKSMEAMKSGSPDRTNFVKALYSRYFFKDLESSTSKANGIHNDALELPIEDFDEATKFAVRIADNGGPWKYRE